MSRLRYVSHLHMLDAFLWKVLHRTNHAWRITLHRCMHVHPCRPTRWGYSFSIEEFGPHVCNTPFENVDLVWPNMQIECCKVSGSAWRDKHAEFYACAGLIFSDLSRYLASLYERTGMLPQFSTSACMHALSVIPSQDIHCCQQVYAHFQNLHGYSSQPRAKPGAFWWWPMCLALAKYMVTNSRAKAA